MAFEKIVFDFIRQSSAYKAFVKNQDAPISADSIDFYPLSALIRCIAEKRGGRVFAIVPTDDYALSLMEDLKGVENCPVILILCSCSTFLGAFFICFYENCY